MQVDPKKTKFRMTGLSPRLARPPSAAPAAAPPCSPSWRRQCKAAGVHSVVPLCSYSAAVRAAACGGSPAVAGVRSGASTRLAAAAAAAAAASAAATAAACVRHVRSGASVVG